MAIIAVEFSTALIYCGNIAAEMSTVIEPQNVVSAIGSGIRIRVANFVRLGCFGDIDAELRVIVPKRRKYLGVSLGRPA